MTVPAGDPALWISSFDTPDLPQVLAGGVTRWAAKDPDSGPDVHVPLPHASFLARHPRLPVLYVTSQESAGSITAIRTDDQQKGVMSRRLTGGAVPCHLSVHPDGGWIYAANYGDGSVTAMAVTSNGDLAEESVRLDFAGSSIVPRRQDSSHPHATIVSPDGGHLVVADLGADVLRTYRLEAGRPAGAPILTPLAPGAGPRHMAWLDSTLYITCELSGEVAIANWDEQNGRVELRSSIAATTNSRDEVFYLSDVLIHSGHVYVGARGCDTISVLVPDGSGGLRLTAEVPTLAWPNHLAVQGNTLLVAATHANRIASHRLGASSVPDGAHVAQKIGSPMCILVEPAP